MKVYLYTCERGLMSRRRCSSTSRHPCLLRNRFLYYVKVDRIENFNVVCKIYEPQNTEHVDQTIWICSIE